MATHKKSFNPTPGIKKAIVTASQNYLKEGNMDKAISLYNKLNESLSTIKTSQESPLAKKQIKDTSEPNKIQVIQKEIYIPLDESKNKSGTTLKTTKDNIIFRQGEKCDFSQLTEMLEEKDIKSSFLSIDEIMNEMSKIKLEYTEEDAYQEKMKLQFPKEIKPSFYPNAYNTNMEYTNKTGFFENIEGNPVFCENPEKRRTVTSNSYLNEDYPRVRLDMLEFEDKEASLSKGLSPKEMNNASSSHLPGHSQNKNVLELSYNIAKLFNSKPYRKYRKLFRQASSAIMNNNLQKGLNYYLALLEQDIQGVLRQMIEKIIQNIENNILAQLNKNKPHLN